MATPLRRAKLQPGNVDRPAKVRGLADSSTPLAPRRAARAPSGNPRGGPHRIVSDAVAGARALVEGTRLSYRAIAGRTGIGATTLCRWRKRAGWVRPRDGEARPRPTRFLRRRGQPYAADAVGQARDLLTGTLLSQAAIARRVGVSQAAISVWLRRRGWVRPSVPLQSRRFAASRRGGILANSGDRRGRPYAPEVRAEARAMWEGTRLSTALIGARLGVHPVTVARWAKEKAWVRPRGRLGRAQLRGLFGLQRAGLPRAGLPRAGRRDAGSGPRIRLL